MINSIKIVNDINDVNFSELKLFDRVLTIKKSNNTNEDIVDDIVQFILVKKFNDMFYVFYEINSGILMEKNNAHLSNDKCLELNNHNELHNEYSYIDINQNKKKKIILNIQNKDKKSIEVEAEAFTYGTSLNLFSINSQKKYEKYEMILYDKFKKIPNKKKTIRFVIKDEYKYIQSIFIPMDKNGGFLFSIIHDFSHYNDYSNKVLSDKDNQFEIGDIAHWSREYLVSYIYSSKNNMHVCEFKKMNFCAIYNYVKKYYPSEAFDDDKDFDDFDKIIDIANYDISKHIRLNDKELYSKLIDEFTIQNKFDKSFIESFYNPIYINENGVKFYRNANAGYKILAVNNKDELINDESDLITNNDNMIAHSISRFNYRRIADGYLVINPYNGDLYKRLKLTKGVDYNILYEDNESLVIYGIGYGLDKVYIMKVNGYYTILSNLSDKELIDEIKNRHLMINKLSSSTQ